MKLVACVSNVPDTATRVKVGSNGKSIDPTGVTYIINPYDEYAVEEALKIKEKIGTGEVIVVSLGGDNNKETIRKALAMGADSGILLKDEQPRDSFGIAKALAEEIKNQGAQLVFMGKQSVDYDNSIVGQMTAELLDYNCVPICVKFEMNGEKIIAEREIEGGREIIETSLPCIITCQKGLNEPRYASLKGIMAAKKKTIEEKPAASFTPGTEVIKMQLPPGKQPGRIIGSDASAVPELVRLLKEEAKVI